MSDATAEVVAKALFFVGNAGWVENDYYDAANVLKDEVERLQRENTDLTYELSDANHHIERLEARVKELEAERAAILALTEEWQRTMDMFEKGEVIRATIMNCRNKLLALLTNPQGDTL